LISEASIPDDLEAMQGKLDVLREKLGITSGWGMKPGDKGYQPDGLPALNTPAQPPTGIEAPYMVSVSSTTINQPA
jgi:hypothetical protein